MPAWEDPAAKFMFSVGKFFNGSSSVCSYGLLYTRAYKRSFLNHFKKRILGSCVLFTTTAKLSDTEHDVRTTVSLYSSSSKYLKIKRWRQLSQLKWILWKNPPSDHWTARLYLYCPFLSVCWSLHGVTGQISKYSFIYTYTVTYTRAPCSCYPPIWRRVIL